VGVWRRQLSLTAVAALLLVVGGAMAVASLAADPALRAAGLEQPVNVGAGDLADIRANNSPTVARNPRDPDELAVTSRVDTPSFSCALHVSADGGERWRRTEVPIPRGEDRKCYAPDVTFAADGVLHLSYVTLKGVGNVPNAVWVTRSRDGGRTLESPTRVSGPKAFGVRIASDPARPRRLYLTWLQARELGSLRFASAGNPIVLARSDDGGGSWQAPVRVSAPERLRVLAASPAIGRQGEVYVLFLDVGDDRLDYEGGHEGFGGPPYGGRFSLVLARSRDGGGRWEESVVDRRVVPIARFIAFLPPFPSLAVDRESGRIYAAFHDRRDGSADAMLWTLERGAARWRGPSRINDTPTGDRTAQELPQLAVAPDGRLDAVYYDRRADPRNVRNEVSLQSSFDAGRTFSPRVRLSSRSFDARIGAGSERGIPDLGSRLGLVSDGDGAIAVWTDTRSGTDASNKQDLLAARASLVGGGTALRDGGLALVAGAVAALGLALVRRHRPALR
jgi:hypothetical protein